MTLIFMCFISITACESNNSSPAVKQEKQSDTDQYSIVVDTIIEDNSDPRIDSIWLKMDISRIDALVYSPHVAGPSMSAYIFNWSKKELHPSVAHNYTKTLNNEHKEIVINHLVYGKDMSGIDEIEIPGCFHPHHGFIYYNSGNEIVGQSSICFECESIRSYPNNTIYIDFEVFKHVFEELDIPILDSDDQYDSLIVLESINR